ncbi:MAG: peptide ABC transporter substrate-binding protein [Fibrobacteres bacterium]|nr:peptide ABC transporter substrate-binding protein [Fibrobacterota bacterium]
MSIKETAALILTILLLFGGAAILFYSSKEERADFTYALSSEPRTLDPALVTALSESRVVKSLFDGLVKLNGKTLKPEPAIARSWTVSANGKEYCFFLRKALWSDGTPVTAHDFVYSWERVLNPSSKSSYDYMLFSILNALNYRQGKVSTFDSVGVKAVNDSTLIVVLEKPLPYFLDLAAFETLLPVNRKCIEKHGLSWVRPENIVSNGAFTLTGHRLNDKMRIKKNQLYWNADKVRFNIIDVRTCEGINTAFNMYETGAADLIEDFPSLITEEILKRSDKCVAPTLGTYFYRFNTSKPPFDDVRVRRAFDLAVNKENLAAYVVKGGEIAAGTLVPPGLPGYIGVEGLKYNPDSARMLMKEAGYPDGKNFPEIELLYNTSENHKRIAEAVAFMLNEALNVKIITANIEWKVLLSRVDNMDYTFVRAGWYGDYTDPNTFLDMFITGGGNNRTGWSNKAYDSLIELASTLSDNNLRMKLFAESETILRDEGPIIPLYYYVSKYLIKPDIKGLYPNIRGYFSLADLYRE